jgi:hypothetical protein
VKSIFVRIHQTLRCSPAMEAGIDSHLWSRSPTVPQISEEQLTRWAESCLRMNHLGTLIQRELKASKENARAIDLAERARRRAWELFNELLKHGARKPAGYAEPEE